MCIVHRPVVVMLQLNQYVIMYIYLFDIKGTSKYKIDPSLHLAFRRYFRMVLKYLKIDNFQLSIAYAVGIWWNQLDEAILIDVHNIWKLAEQLHSYICGFLSTRFI